MKLLISNFEDISNIFHILNWEMFEIWNRTSGDGYYNILLRNFSDSAPCRWRWHALNAIYKNVFIENVPSQLRFDEVEEISTFNSAMVNSFKFETLSKSPFYISMANHIKEFYGTKNNSGEEVVYIERTRDRILYDYATREPLGPILRDMLSRAGIPLRIENFDHANFDHQINALSNARILVSCHGAANTNLFMLPKNATLFEVNFRKYWFCDPVCERHKSGELRYTEMCSGPLLYSEEFHKADYHNLSQIFGVGYREFQVEDAREFLSDNPISIKELFVDGKFIAEQIKAAFT